MSGLRVLIGAMVGAMLVGLALTVAAAAQPRAPWPPPREPQAGDFLVASRRLDDANFAQSVVLLLHYGPDGAQGVVVNRRTLMRVAVVLPGIEAFTDRPDTLYWGGPVKPQSAILLARLADPPPQGLPVLDGVWAVRTVEAMDELLRLDVPQESLRVFGGYAGWTPGQLEHEISQGSWHVLDGDADRVFQSDVGRLWETLQRIANAPRA